MDTPTPRRTSVLLSAFIATVLALLGGLAFVWHAGGELAAPAQRAVGSPPPALAAESVTFASASGSSIHGWLSRGMPGSGAVLLVHGVRGNRTDMAGRALFLHQLGYSVLLIDLQAHGESPGRWITFGDLESRDIVAAVELLRRTFPQERIGIIGTSLGAASTVLAEKPLHVSAVVLESMYPTIEQAVADRLSLHLGSWAGALSRPLIAMLSWRIHVDPRRLHPIDAIDKLGAPLLMIHGTQDEHTRSSEAQALFAAAAPPKKLWLVEGAAHVDLHRYAGSEYERRVADFLRGYLHGDLKASS